jgi:hypothetical protein
MIRDETVFILGAGASAPYGYPVGSAFKDDICLHFKSDIDSLMGSSQSSNDLMDLVEQADEFTNSFQRSRVRSIDRWLSLNRHFANIGKLAIVNSIVKHENPNELLFEGKDKSLDWFTVLFNVMISSLSRPEHFSYNKIAFITFNYDRLLEHLFYESFKHTFTRISDQERDRILSSLSIIHVYGAIDDPPWKKNGYAYGKDYRLGYLNNSRTRIRIIHERTEEDVIMTLMREQIIQTAKKVFFLGFGYDVDNLRIVNIPDDFKGDPQIFGTAYDLLSEEIDRVVRMMGSKAVIKKCDCTELLRRFLV